MSNRIKLHGTLPVPILQTGRQAELESNSVVRRSPVKAGTSIHSIFSAGLLMLILENTPLLSQTLPSFLLKRAEECKETAICTEVKLSCANMNAEQEIKLVMTTCSEICSGYH